MPSATLVRFEDTGKCTKGYLKFGRYTLFTIERPWRDNQRGESCIPSGTYEVAPHGWHGEKVRKPRSYELLNTAPREGILIHAGNVVEDVIGCIAVGMKYGTLNGEDAVLASEAAMVLLRQVMGERHWMIEITAAPTGPSVKDKESKNESEGISDAAA